MRAPRMPSPAVAWDGPEWTPKAYRGIIKAAQRKHPSALFTSTHYAKQIRQESHFEADAVSPAGAKGAVPVPRRHCGAIRH